VYRFIRYFVLILPAFLMVCAITLPFTPGMFSDGAKPFYYPATQPLFLAALFYSYPVTFLCTRFVSDDMFLSPGYFLVLALYTALWILCLRSIFRFFEQRAIKAG
jgi:peptidoglycan/LPS O-acetylase OafA/YrhL